MFIVTIILFYLPIPAINNNLSQQPEWIRDSTGRITGYKNKDGADTVFPFSSFEVDSITFSGANTTRSVPLKAYPKFVAVTCNSPSSSPPSVFYNGNIVYGGFIYSVSDKALVILSSWSSSYTFTYYVVY